MKGSSIGGLQVLMEQRVYISYLSVDVSRLLSMLMVHRLRSAYLRQYDLVSIKKGFHVVVQAF